MLGKLTVPAAAKLRQFQQLVYNMKKKEVSFLSKLRRQKIDPRPDVPARDYKDDRGDGEDQLSDTDDDNDLYEDPLEEDNYEVPPSQESTTTPTAATSQAEYLYSCNNKPSRPPRRPLPPGKVSKQPPPELAHYESDDEDYIEPEVCSSDSNYFQPTENPPPNPVFNRRHRSGETLPALPSHVANPRPNLDFYEAPDWKENSLTFPKSRNSSLSTQLFSSLLKPRRRSNPRGSPPPVQEPTSDDEYEVCDPNDGCKETPARSPPPLLPKPLPRGKSPKPPLGPKIELKAKFESKPLPVVLADHKTPPKPFPLEQKRLTFPLPLSSSCTPSEREGSAENEKEDQDEDIIKKPWFAATCNRKTAEDILVQFNKDGAFLVRKSAGQATQHPYTLAVFCKGRVYNIPIRFISSTQLYALGSEKQGEEHFTSVSHIIENHQKNPLVLIDSQSNSKDATKLLYPTKP